MEWIGRGPALGRERERAEVGIGKGVEVGIRKSGQCMGIVRCPKKQLKK